MSLSILKINESTKEESKLQILQRVPLQSQTNKIDG